MDATVKIIITKVNNPPKFIDAPFEILRLQAGHSLMQLKQDSVLNAVFSHIKNS